MIKAPEVPQQTNGTNGTNGHKHDEEKKEEPKVSNGNVTDTKIPDSVHKKLETQINGADEKPDTEPMDAAAHNTGAGPSIDV
jgi:methylenetetrahydrofolate reductase (NADPH)